ncbi:MAG: formylglycine-generating enzyme family protein, partial [Treponema sp.]|nr:formylglycine-generating enzyme family protein [Treponema sp.]
MKNKLWVIAILTAFTLSTTPCFAQGGGDKTTTSPAGDKATTSPAEDETTSPAGTETTSPTGIVMVSIPAGTFIMGSPASEPDREPEGADETQHSVTLSGFKMSKYEVTQEQYQAVMGSNPSFFTFPLAGETQGKRPVESVSWYDAIVFCNRLSIKEGLRPAYSLGGNTDPAAWGNVPTLTFQNATWNAMQIVEGSNGYRLPTEAQWEYACRAGTTTAYNTGNTISDDTGWYA